MVDRTRAILVKKLGIENNSFAWSLWFSLRNTCFCTCEALVGVAKAALRIKEGRAGAGDKRAAYGRDDGGGTAGHLVRWRRPRRTRGARATVVCAVGWWLPPRSASMASSLASSTRTRSSTLSSRGSWLRLERRTQAPRQVSNNY